MKSHPQASGEEHAGLLALAEKLEADPSSAAGFKTTIEPMLSELETEMQKSHDIAQTEIDGLVQAFATCGDQWETEKTNAAVPNGSPHSTCRLDEAAAKQAYDACHSVQVTLEAAMVSACGVWEKARDKLASKDQQPEVLTGETHLDYMKRLQAFVAQEIESGDQLEAACEAARESHASKVAECEGEGGSGALKKIWLDKQQQCNVEQGLFEAASCSYTQQLETACASHTTCFDATMDLWNTQTAAIKQDAESRKASLWMVQRIRCLLDVFSTAGHHNDVDQAEVDKCKSKAHDQTQFDLPIPANPAKPEECPLLPKPCMPDWTDEAYSNTSDAPLATCTPCGHKATEPELADLAGHWDACDTGSLVYTAQGIEEWKDISGAGFDVTPSSTGEKPSFTSTEKINGKSAVRFQGGSYLSSQKKHPTFTDHPFTWFVALQSAVDGGERWGWNVFSTNEDKEVSAWYTESLYNPISICASGVHGWGSGPSNWGYRVKAHQLTVLAYRWDGTNFDVWMADSSGGGSPVKMIDAWKPSSAKFRSIHQGYVAMGRAMQNDHHIFDGGLLGEAMAFTVAKSDLEVTSLIERLATKWMAPTCP